MIRLAQPSNIVVINIPSVLPYAGSSGDCIITCFPISGERLSLYLQYETVFTQRSYQQRTTDMDL